MIRRCCDLHIVARAHRAVRTPHLPRLRIGERGPCFLFLGDLLRTALGTLGLLRFDLGQLGACLFDPLLHLLQATCPRRLGALGTRRRVRIDLGFQGNDTSLGCSLRLIQPKRPLVRTLARRSLDLGAIDHDLVGVKQPLRHERRQRFGQQAVEHIGVRHPEVRKPVVVDRHTARDPAVGQILAGQPVQFARRAHPVHRRQKPQRKQHSRVRGRPPRHPLARLDLVVQHRQIQRLDEANHQSRPVVGRQPAIRIDQVPRQLRPVRYHNPRPATSRPTVFRIHQNRLRTDGSIESQFVQNPDDFFTGSRAGRGSG